jgi:uncharacterized protein
VKPTHNQYLSNRVLKINVGFLLSDGPGHSQDSRLDIPEPVRVADDLTINTIDGNLRLTRTKEGILVQSKLMIGVDAECSRCLDTFQHHLNIDVEELYMHPAPIASEFFVGQDAILDLAPLLRAEVLIQTSHPALCREDCKGLCPTCGINRNHETCDCETETIDPRFAALKALLDKDK